MDGIFSKSLFNVLLSEAKTPEEILKLIKYKYGENMPERFIETVFSMDPTKKKSFTRWACEMFISDKDKIIDCLEDGRLKGIFDYFKKNSNKLSLSDIKSVDEAISYAFTITLEDIISKDGEGPENDFTYEDVDSVWGVATYNTYEASKKLGQYCKWCTAGAYGNGDYYFKSYKNDGDIYILFKKDEEENRDGRHFTVKRYQLFFPNNYSDKPLEFNDSSNNGTTPEDSGFTEAITKYFEDRGHSLNDGAFMSNEERMEIYDEWRYNNEIAGFEVNGTRFCILPVFDEDYDIREYVEYGIYPEDDDTGLLDGSYSYSESYFEDVEIDEYNHFAVLRLKNGDIFAVINIDGDYYCEDYGEIKANTIGDFNFLTCENDIILEFKENVWILPKRDDNFMINVPEQSDNEYSYITIKYGKLSILVKLDMESPNYEYIRYNNSGKNYIFNGEDYVSENSINGDKNIIATRYGPGYLIDVDFNGYSIFEILNSERFGVWNNQEEKIVVQPVYYGYDVVLNTIVLIRNGNTKKGGLWGIDVFNHKTGEISEKGQFMQYISDNRVAIQNGDGSFTIYKVNCEEEGENFSFDKFEGYIKPLVKAIKNNESIIFNVESFRVCEGIKDMTRENVFCILTTSNGDKIIEPIDNGAIKGIGTNIGKASNISFFTNYNILISALYEEEGKYGLFDYSHKLFVEKPEYFMIERDYNERGEVLRLYVNKNEFTLFDTKYCKRLFNGMIFSEDEYHNKVCEYNGTRFVVDCLTFSDGPIIKGVEKNGIGYRYNEMTEYERKKGYELLDILKRTRVLNENIKTNFYDLLERIEKSKYTML